MIFGGRIEQAREFRGLTQSELASHLGIEQAVVSKVERGSWERPNIPIQQIADYLDFPVSFFERAPCEFSLGTLDFRTRSDTTAKAKKRAYQYARLVFEIAVVLARRLRMPQIRLPTLQGDPEEAARLCRSELGLSPDSPIINLTDSLERAGVFVFALPDLSAGCDGFSAWGTVERRIIPAVYVSAAASGDRARLTVAHEIGELTLIDKPAGREREKMANWFAGALLMPADGYRKNLVPPVSIHDLAEMKRYYGVSIQAALVRAYQLGIISDRRYRSLYKQISVEGWRKNEPIKVPFEKPRGLTKMAEVLYGEQINVVRLAQEVALRPIFVRSLLSAHASKSDLRGIARARKADVIPLQGHHGRRDLETTSVIREADEA